MRVYRWLADALRDGFFVVDRTKEGYLVHRKRADEKWELALVDLTNREIRGKELDG